MKIIFYLWSSALIFGVILLRAPASAGGVDDIRVLKISGQDERAVVKLPNGKMKVIKTGDSLGEQGVVIEVAKDRIVVEEKKGKLTETVIIRLENGKQRVERLRKSAERQPELYAPQQPAVVPGKKALRNEK